MCGISAIFRTKPSVNLDRLVAASLGLIKHRGPDGRGICIGRGDQVYHPYAGVAADWALGHVRLAILDLSDTGAQPMSVSNQRFWITYNGEIYNYIEIKDELERAGHRFIGSSDTEVILTAYSEWGTECLNKFNGMFAFVIVDIFNRSVFAARDRFGVKPLYYWIGYNDCAFVSEIKQLWAMPEFAPRVNKQQVTDYLVDSVLGHESDQCCFEGVHPLKPGHYLKWNLGQMPSLESEQCYWKPTEKQHSPKWETAVSEFGELFEDSVRIRLRSDVPVGVCVSGGVDSSSIAAVVSRELSHPLATFSNCSSIAKFDEQFYIDIVNKSYSAISHKVFPSQDALIQEIDELIYHQDEPFVGLNQYAQFCVMRQARLAEVPVLLNGQGGDEILCGYKKFAFFYLQSLFGERKYGAALRHFFHSIVNGDRRILDWRSGLRYLPNWFRKGRDDISPLLRPHWQTHARKPWSAKMGNEKGIRKHQLADIRRWSLPVLLRYEDRNSMAHGVETRLPFVDYRLVDYAISLPEDFFYKFGRSKRLLVERLGSKLPQEIRDRKSKMGFELPDQVWMKGPLGRYFLEKISSSQSLHEILDTKMAANIMKEYISRPADTPHYSHLLLERIAILALWLDRFHLAI